MCGSLGQYASCSRLVSPLKSTVSISVATIYLNKQTVQRVCAPALKQPPLLFLSWQIIYAGLDAFAAALLRRHVMEKADPVFVLQQPDVASLTTGTAVRLYTRTNTRCIAEGTAVDYSAAQTFGGTGLAVGKRISSDRVVVMLTEIRVPGALALHPSEDGTRALTLQALGVQACLLQETVRSNAA